MDMKRDPFIILTELVNLGQKSNPAFVPFEPADLEFSNRVDAPSSQGQPDELARDSQIDCKVLRDDVDKVTQVYYARYNLGEKHPDGLSLEYEGETTTGALLDKINDALNIKLTTDDVINTTFPAPTNFPGAVTVVARSESLMYKGQLQIVLLGAEDEDDTAFLTAPVIAHNDEISENFQTEQGTMHAGSGNPATEFTTANNAEIEVGVGVRKFNNADLPIGTSGTYNFNIGDSEDWTIPFSVGLLDTRNGTAITDLYDVKLEITSAETTETLELTLQRTAGAYHLVNVANNIDITDGYENAGGSLYQEIQRASFYKTALGNPESNPDGALLGEYEITLTATRKQGGVPPVVAQVSAHIGTLA